MNYEIIQARHDFDREYREGTHWDTEKPSSNMSQLTELLQGNEKILDAGCGLGRDVIYLAKQGFHVTGVDESPIAIEIAQERARDLDGAEFAVGKIERLPFTSSYFDAVYSGYTLRGETIPQQAKELARVTKPEGILYVAMFTRTEYEKRSPRNELNPEMFVLESFGKYFSVQDKSTKTYTEEDDHGQHEHDLLKLILLNKKPT